VTQKKKMISQEKPPQW